MHPGLVTRSGEHPLEGRGRLRRVHDPMPAEAGRGRDGTGQHRRQGRLVDLHDDPLGGDPAAYVGEMGRHALGERLRQLASSAVVGEHLVAARLLDGRGERPRAGHLDLERSLEVLGLLLQRVEVLGEQRAGPPVVDAGSVGEPPAGRLEVEAEVGDHRDRPAGHARGRTAARQLREVGQVGQLAEHDADRLGVLLRVVAGPRPDAGGDAHAVTSARAVETMVAEPTTRVPSYITAAWPGAIPWAGSSSSISTMPVGRTSSTCRDHDDRPVGGAVGAQLHRPRVRRGSGAAPARPVGDDPVDGQRVARADRDRAGDRLDVEHEARLAVRRGHAEPQPAALADGEAVGAVVAPELRTRRRVDDRAPVVGRPVAELLAQPAGVVAVGDEADVVGVGLVGDEQPTSRGLRADRRLRGVTEREQRVGAAGPG